MRAIVSRLMRSARRVGLRPTLGGGLRPPGGRSGATRFASEPAGATFFGIALALFWLVASAASAREAETGAASECFDLNERSEICLPERVWHRKPNTGESAWFEMNDVDRLVVLTVTVNCNDDLTSISTSESLRLKRLGSMATGLQKQASDANAELDWRYLTAERQVYGFISGFVGTRQTVQFHQATAGAVLEGCEAYTTITFSEPPQKRDAQTMALDSLRAINIRARLEVEND